MPISAKWTILVAVLAVICWLPMRTYQNSLSKEELRERYGEWAVVAGASEGLGAAWAELLCENGLNVLLVARRQEAMADLSKRMNGCQVDTLVQDLSVPHLEETFAKVFQERDYGLLVYNAAYGPAGTFLDSSLNDHYKSIDTNVRGVLALSHAFGNAVRARKGETGGIILMASVAGIVGLPNVATYGATKSWNTVFAHGLYREMKPMGIDVLSCLAGATITPNYLAFGGREDDAIAQSPQAVASECLAGLGKLPSLATGPLNKFTRFLFQSLLTPSQAIEMIGSENDKILARKAQ